MSSPGSWTRTPGQELQSAADALRAEIAQTAEQFAEDQLVMENGDIDPRLRRYARLKDVLKSIEAVRLHLKHEAQPGAEAGREDGKA